MCKNLDTSGWQLFDYFDLSPEPGAFLSRTGSKIFKVNDVEIEAFTWLHAQYLWLKREIDASGAQFGKCEYCGHWIRHAYVYEDPEGRYHMVGMDCSAFIASNNPSKADFLFKKCCSDIKKVSTKNGEKYVLCVGEVPAWFWRIPKEERPSYYSVSKFTPYGAKRPKYYLSIWGDEHQDVVWRYTCHNKEMF